MSQVYGVLGRQVFILFIGVWDFSFVFETVSYVTQADLTLETLLDQP